MSVEYKLSFYLASQIAFGVNLRSKVNFTKFYIYNCMLLRQLFTFSFYMNTF